MCQELVEGQKSTWCVKLPKAQKHAHSCVKLLVAQRKAL